MTDKSKPADIEVEVVNPRYEGATIEIVGRALLQRPPKVARPKRDEPETD